MVYICNSAFGKFLLMVKLNSSGSDSSLQAFALSAAISDRVRRSVDHPGGDSKPVLIAWAGYFEYLVVK